MTLDRDGAQIGAASDELRELVQQRLAPSLNRGLVVVEIDWLQRANLPGFDAHEIGQPLLVDCGVVEQPDRQVEKARVLGEHGQERLGRARAEPFADYDAVHVAGVEVVHCGLDAERTDEPEALADRDRKRWIGGGAADAQHCCAVEQAGGNRGRDSRSRARAARAPQHRGMQGSHPQRRAHSRNQPLGGIVQCDCQRARDGRPGVVIHQRDDRHDRTAARLDAMDGGAKVRFGDDADAGDRRNRLSGHPA